MATAPGKYSVVAANQTVSTAITILQYTAPADAVAILRQAWVSARGVTAPAQVTVEVLRKTAGITGTASPPALKSLSGGAQTAGGTVAWLATAEGTDGDILHTEDFDVLSGWRLDPAYPIEIRVPPSGIIALKFPAAPASTAFDFGFEIEEFV